MLASVPMEQGLSDLFNTPPEWAAFSKLGEVFGDGWLGIDLLPILQAITPAFKTYRDMTYPRHFTRKAGTDGLREQVDYYVLPRGLSRSGTIGYRVIRTGTQRRVSVLDIDRVLDDAELYGRKTNRPKDFDIVRNLRDTVVGTQMETVQRQLKSQSRWVHDLRFLIQGAPDYFQYMDDARDKAVSEMMVAIEGSCDLDDTKLRLLRGYLVDEMVAHDAHTTTLTQDLLAQARGQLNPEVVALLAEQPATQTLRHYKFLSRGMREIVKEYPVLLLVDNFEKEIKELDSTGIYNRRSNPINLYPFLKTLREHDIGAHNARHLRHLLSSQYWDWPRKHQPDTVEAWDKVSAIHRASGKAADVLNLNRGDIFNSLVLALKDDDNVILDHLCDAQFADIRIRDTREWMNYLSSLIAIRIYTDTRAVGVDMPFIHALYASGFDTPAVRDVAQNTMINLRRRLQSAVLPDGGLVKELLKDHNVLTSMEYAYAYISARKAEDAPLSDVLVSNRLLEHGASYTWGALPDVFIEDEGTYVTAITSQDALLKNALRYNHDLWKRAVGAITGKSHFLDITGERGSLATAHITEPEHAGEAWDIVDVAPHARGRGHNAMFAVVEQYLQHPDFIAGYHAKNLQATRDALVTRLGAQAKSNEYLGINHKNHADRVEYLRAFERFLPDIDGGFGMTASGAISSPAIDAMVANLIDRVATHYKPKGQNPAYKIG